MAIVLAGRPGLRAIWFTLFLLSSASMPGFGDAWDDFEALRSGGAVGGSSALGGGANPGAAKPGSLENPADERLTREAAAKTGFTLPSNAENEYRYLIGPHDVIEIEVFQVEELNHTARVNSRGYISVPLLGRVQVGGLSVEEAEKRIADGLGKDYLQEPHVSIFVVDYVSQKFTVEGEVKDPGVFPIKGPTTLLQAIAMADGLAKLADEEGIVLFRTDRKTGKTAGFIVDLEKLRSGEKEDPLIANGDMIVVPKAGDKAFLEGFTNALRGFIGFGIL